MPDQKALIDQFRTINKTTMNKKQDLLANYAGMAMYAIMSNPDSFEKHAQNKMISGVTLVTLAFETAELMVAEFEKRKDSI